MSGRCKLMVLLLGLSLVASGCVALVAGAAGGAAGIVYVRGEAKTAFPHDVETLFNAAVLAMEQDMKVPIESKAYDLTDGRIDARRADDNKVKVRLKLVGADVTEVRVRVGTIGDKTWSMLYLEKIESHLPGAK